MKVNCLYIFLSLLMFSCGCKSDEIYVENRRILNIDISNVNNPLNDTIPYKIYGINLKIIDTVSNYIPIDLQNVTNFNQGGLLLLKPSVAPVINKNYNFILKATLNNNLVLTDTIHKVFLK